MIPTSAASQLMASGEVVGSDGDTIGKVGTVYVDDSDGHLTWVTVKTGWFGSNESFVPLDDATLEGDTITVPYTKDKVKDAPNHDVDASLSVEEEQDLYSYYGVSNADDNADSRYTADDRTAVSDTTVSNTTVSDTTAGGYQAAAGYEAPAGSEIPAVDSAAAVSQAPAGAEGYITRSEEELRVGTRQVEAGRARLKKYVVTEQQTVTVPVSHEEVTLVREPIAAGEVTDATIGEDVVEVVLTEDEVVVDKQAVAVEKIRLDTETVTEQQQVTEDVRKEQIELDTDGITTTDTTGYTTSTDRDATK